jgi:Fur family zinc uptake transcriptional regulator
MPDGTKPPTVYRALEFWEQEGFIHRIGSLNVYTLCHAGHRHDGGQFLICDSCGDVTEAHICDMPPGFKAEAKAQGFHLDGWFLELHGLCKKCQPGAEHSCPHGCAH